VSNGEELVETVSGIEGRSWTKDYNSHLNIHLNIIKYIVAG